MADVLDPIKYTQDSRVNQQGVFPSAIQDRQIASLSFDKAQGGTLTLGGVNNGNGLMQVKDASGNVVIQGDNAGHTYYDTSGNDLVIIDELGFRAYDTSGNNLIKVDSTGLHGYDTSAVEQMRLNASGLFVYGSSFDALKFRTTAGASTSYGTLGYTTGTYNGFYLLSDTGQDLFIDSGGQLAMWSAGFMSIESQANGLYIDTLGGNDIVINTRDGSGGHILLQDDNADSFYLYDGSANKQIKIDDNGGATRIQRAGSTAKTAIMHTSDGYKAVYCAESPEVWFFDFIDDKTKLDPLFIEITSQPYKYTKCDDGTYQVWGRRKDMSNTRFESKTVDEFKSNDKFWRQAEKKIVERVVETPKGKQIIHNIDGGI